MFNSYALDFATATSDWMRQAVGNSLSSFFTSYLQLYAVATLQFDTKLQKCIKIEITIFKLLFIQGGISDIRRYNSLHKNFEFNYFC